MGRKLTAYPDIEELLRDHPLEHHDAAPVLTVRRTLWSMGGLIAALIGSAGVVFLLIYLSRYNAFFQRYFYFVEPTFFTVIPLVIGLELLRRLHNDLYIFSINRLTHQRGRLSFSYNVPVIRYEDIRAINVVQDFWGRVFGYGDILIGTAAQLGNEIIICGVKHPESLALLLDNLRARLLSDNIEKN